MRASRRRCGASSRSSAHSIAAGETATFSFDIGREQLGFWLTDATARFVVEPGVFVLHVGPTLERTQPVTAHRHTVIWRRISSQVA